MGLFDRFKEVNQRSGLSIALDLAAAVKQRLLAKDHGPRIEAPKEEHGPAVVLRQQEEHGPTIAELQQVQEPEGPTWEEMVQSLAQDLRAERLYSQSWGRRLDLADARRAQRLAADRVRRVTWATESPPAKITRKTVAYWMARGLCFRPERETGEVRSVRQIRFDAVTLELFVQRTKQIQVIPAQRRPSADVYANWKWVGSRLVHMTDAEFFAHEMRLRQYEQRERDARRYTPPKRGGTKRDVVVAAPVVVEAAPAPQIEAVKSAPKVMSLGNMTSLEFLADEFDVSPDAVLKVAFDLGMRSVTPATEVDGETAEIIAVEFGWTVTHAE